MKYWLFLALVFVLFTQCRPDISSGDVPEETTDTIKVAIDTPIHVIDLGKGFTLKNKKTWEASFNAWYYSEKKEFLIAAKYENSKISESMTVSHIPCRLGKFPVEFLTVKNFYNQTPEIFFSMMYEYDQPMGFFFADTTRNDQFIEVIHLDTIGNTVEGRFQIFLGKDPMSTDWPGVPDSIFFTEGRFHLRIQKP